MAPNITQNINIKVKPRFLEMQSSVARNQFLFSYKVTIENHNPYAVQLLSRHWYIFDSNSDAQEVKGEGVVGEQPIIEGFGSHSYQSYCELQTDIGMMWGSYLMRNCENEKLFEVQIPEFQLITPARLN